MEEKDELNFDGLISNKDVKKILYIPVFIRDDQSKIDKDINTESEE